MKLKMHIALVSLAIVSLLAPSAAFAALTVGSTSVTSDAGLTLSGAVGSAITLGSTATTGAITIGGTTQTGTITVGRSTGSHTIEIGSVPISGSQTIRIAHGNNGASSNSNVYIANNESSVASAQKYVYIANNNFGAGPTNVKIGVNDFGTSTNYIRIGGGDVRSGGSTEINLGTGFGNSGSYTGNFVNIGSTDAASSLSLLAGTGNVLIQGAVTTTYTMGTATGTGTITLGLSTASNTISIGSANSATGNTQTINIGAGTPAGTGKAVITVGNIVGGSSVALQAGTGRIHLVGQLVSEGTAPTPTQSAGSATIDATSTDTAGVVTTDTTAHTTVTVTFAATYTTAPVCIVTAGNVAAGVIVSEASVGMYTTVDATSLVIHHASSVGAAVWNYHCIKTE